MNKQIVLLITFDTAETKPMLGAVLITNSNKMNEKLIKQLREGTIALKNDGTLEELNKVLRYAFSNDVTSSKGYGKYYFVLEDKKYWYFNDTTYLPSHSVKEFLKPESEYPKVMKVSNKPIETLEEFKNANTRVVFMEKCGKFIAWLHVNTIEKSENVTSTAVWNYAVDLDWQPEEETKPLKLTMEQIAEKFNVEKIEIVNYENKD